MTEFISRNYGNKEFEVIIKTDSKEHYLSAEDFARRLISHAKPQTHGDSVRAMSDKELAKFLADRFAKEHCHRLYGEGRMLTATQIKAITFDWYCAWMKWLQQPAED